MNKIKKLQLPQSIEVPQGWGETSPWVQEIIKEVVPTLSKGDYFFFTANMEKPFSQRVTVHLPEEVLKILVDKVLEFKADLPATESKVLRVAMVLNQTRNNAKHGDGDYFESTFRGKGSNSSQKRQEEDVIPFLGEPGYGPEPVFAQDEYF